MTARRLDDVLRSDPRPTVDIYEILGGPMDVPGPRWILDPPRDVQRDFWKRFGSVIKPEADVSVSEGPVLAEHIRDATREPIPWPQKLTGAVGAVFLFFVDRIPAANWAHPCWYIVRCDDGQFVLAEHSMPPARVIPLISLPRLELVR